MRPFLLWRRAPVPRPGAVRPPHGGALLAAAHIAAVDRILPGKWDPGAACVPPGVHVHSDILAFGLGLANLPRD